ncbi:hypothetical protein SDC9_152631 [bioreactor metagenome]|uniref:Uncharacterized protein n=1 Tax=bioreactor metagenome TaxID=1076179 RepID=A0A645ETM0_9ZZZZ
MRRAQMGDGDFARQHDLRRIHHQPQPRQAQRLVLCRVRGVVGDDHAALSVPGQQLRGARQSFVLAYQRAVKVEDQVLRRMFEPGCAEVVVGVGHAGMQRWRKVVDHVNELNSISTK